ncbi:Cleavage induced protein [Phytophthora megakarya]|uniref:Cleavage induced protein n=1 Tax=Phytophthora megakarya TaxID=4795 RepID=A0A225VNV3_9STRA|nr:Cleavage induced protein [Phytophthora megakarya]
MKKFLLQDPSNAGWVKAQEARTKTNTVNDQIHLQAYPELSKQSRASIDIKAVEARIEQQQIRRLCHDIVLSAVDAVFTQLSGKCNIPANTVTNRHYNIMTWKERSFVVFYYLHPSLANMDSEITCSFRGPSRLKEAMQAIPAKFRNLHDVSTFDLESGVSIPIRFRIPTTKRYLTVTSHPLMSRQKAVKVAKG